jgi:hypothetical protein
MKRTAITLLAGLSLAGVASAQTIVPVAADITGPVTWTSDNVYDLQQIIYVRDGGALTIEPGTVIASSDEDGTLVVTKTGTIFACGTKARPIVFTSSADRATWPNGNPKNGTWREASQEWGNVTIMGNAFMNDHNVGTNVSTCNAANRGTMEGLTGGGVNDQYGGGSDDDDRGTFKYVSLRYGGRNTAVVNVELNGLALGAIGRDTDIHHIDIMNNVDDGIEVWGGTVNLKYLNIWNVGDDSLDIDQGYRGKIQFVLIVQGYSTQGSQGSGTGDNLFEIDGAEDCHWQPVTTTVIYNATAIGQPDSPTAVPARSGGDHATAWRSNARVQYRNSIFMDVGERLVALDNTDGSPDFSCGYGANGTLTWDQTWTTDFDGVTSPCGGTGTPQVDGNLAEISDSIFFNNDNASAYTTYNAVTALVGDNNVNNVVEPVNSPIRMIVRGAAVDYSTFRMQPVVSLDPRPANDATTSVAAAPNDGFFTPAQYRGAFRPDEASGIEVRPWICGWTASDAFGFVKPCKADSRKL